MLLNSDLCTEKLKIRKKNYYQGQRASYKGGSENDLPLKVGAQEDFRGIQPLSFRQEDTAQGINCHIQRGREQEGKGKILDLGDHCRLINSLQRMWKIGSHKLNTVQIYEVTNSEF